MASGYGGRRIWEPGFGTVGNREGFQGFRKRSSFACWQDQLWTNRKKARDREISQETMTMNRDSNSGEEVGP